MTRAAAVVMAAFLTTLVCSPAAAQSSCVGDCDGDGEVSIHELTTGVSIALGSRMLDDCPQLDGNADGGVRINELIAAVNNALSGCPAVFGFLDPADGILLMAGTVAATLAVPPNVDLGSLIIELDGADVTDSFDVPDLSGVAATEAMPLTVYGTLAGVGEGSHLLAATADMRGSEYEQESPDRVRRRAAGPGARSEEAEYFVVLQRRATPQTVSPRKPDDGRGFLLTLSVQTAQTTFDAVALEHPDECEVLNNGECGLPYPSSRFLVSANTPTGLRLNLPQVSMPTVNGPPISTAPYNELDGFSPTVQILMHFPQGVDPERSNASRLQPPGCCGQPAGPPWIGTRTYDGRSLDADSPTVLLDAATGERILHFIERDAMAAGNPARQVLFLRPGRSLVPSRRYIVAMRNLKDPDGDDVQAEAAFAALRDGRPTAIPAIEERRNYMETEVFAVLEREGIARQSMVLAFDFTVQSEHQLTHQMLSMRDQAFDYVAGLEAVPDSVNFTVIAVDEHDCDVPGQVVWRDVSGTYQSPLFLTGDPDAPGVPVLNVDASDTPVQNGFMSPPFSVSIPCSVLDPHVTSHPIVLGHGAFGTGAGMTGSGSDGSGIPNRIGQVADWTYIAGATDWRGLSSSDLGWLMENIVGSDGLSRFNNFPALPDRLRQGVLNTLVLAKMMKLGLFNRDPAFRTPTGIGAFPGPSEEMYYYGISLGGIMGTFFSALTPDVERFGLDVPTINFLSCLTQRSTQFGPFISVVKGIGLDDPMQMVLFLSLMHELWVGAEGAGFARHITRDPLPGSGSAKRILMRPAWLDMQVPNQCTEITARTLGLSNLDGSLQQGLQEIPDAVGPLDSALVMYDSGSFDVFNPLHEPFIPPLGNLVPSGVCDPHGALPRTPAAIVQLVSFLRPGGRIENFCEGPARLCDADRPFEIANGDAAPCDPLSGE